MANKKEKNIGEYKIKMWCVAGLYKCHCYCTEVDLMVNYKLHFPNFLWVFKEDQTENTFQNVFEQDETLAVLWNLKNIQLNIFGKSSMGKVY